MRKLFRGIFLVLLLSISALPVLAQDVSDEAVVRIIPNEAEVGRQHIILITGLLDNEQVSVRIVSLADDDIVYESQQTADNRGILEVIILTDEDDVPGDYRVEVLNADGDVIGSAELSILEATTFEPEVTITPLEAEVGSSFTIEIVGVRPFARLEVIIENEDGEDIFSQATRATVDGEASIEFVSDATHSGVLSVSVIENDRTRIAEIDIIVSNPGITATIITEPAQPLPGDTVYITVSGLEASTATTIEIVHEGTVLASIEDSANVSGLLILSYTFAADGERGDYEIRIYQNDLLVGELDLIVDIPPVSASITPEIGTVGTVFVLTVNDLRPDEEITVEFIFDGEVVQTRTARADAEGIARTTLGQRIDLELGAYDVRVLRLGEEVFTGTVEVAEERPPSISAINPEDVTVSVSPESGTIPTAYTVTVEGLPADTNLDIAIILEGESVFTLSGTADADGTYSTVLSSDPSDIPGIYSLEVRVAGEVIGTAEFEIADESSETPDEENGEEAVETVALSFEVTPPVGTIGTVFVLTVNGLEADEEITVEFIFDDEVVQTRSTHADAEGIARTTLGQRIDLELGVYDVRVLRSGEEIFTGTVEVAEERPPSPPIINPEDVTVSISPESGAVPTSFNLTIEGLPADTNLDMAIVFDGEVVFNFTGTADADGLYSTVITTSESDAPGIYTVEVRAADNVIGAVEFEIVADGDAVEVAPTGEGDVRISIEPTTLRQGERIEFIISNLAPEETITFELLYEGEVIYRTESTANAAGAAGVALRAEDDEALGEYEVRVIREDAIIASNGFEIVASDAEISNAAIRVSPESAAQGADFAITVTGLASGEMVDVIISLDGEITYGTEREANDEGAFTLVLRSDSSDALGSYDVIVVRENGDDLEASFMINEAGAEVAAPEEEEEARPTIRISPDEGDIGTRHEISISGLEANEAFTFIIEFDGDEVYSVEHTADDEGNFSTSITAATGDPIGAYDIIIERDDAENLTATLLVTGDEAPDEEEGESELALSIDPQEVEREEPFEILITGLEADETVVVAVLFAGDIVFETESSANDEGEISLDLSADEGDPTGTYTVIVRRGDEEVSANVEVTDASQAQISAGDVEISVEPDSGAVGSEYVFNIAGLGSNTEFDIIVEFDGEIVYQTTRLSDASGFFEITLETGEGDATGTYTFMVVQDGETLAAVDFEITDEVASSQEESGNTGSIEQVPAPVTYTDDVSIEFDADSTVHLIEFNGQAGDVISVTVDSGDTLDTVATLISPSGEVIATDDDGGFGLDPEIERAVLPDTGIYTLEVRTFTSGDSGSATVTIRRNDVRTLDDDETRVVTLNSKITTDILTFEGEAGEVISLVIELDSGAVSALVISAEQNDTLLMNYETFGLPQTVVLGFVVPENGTVLIYITDDGSNTTVLNASIERE